MPIYWTTNNRQSTPRYEHVITAAIMLAVVGLMIYFG
jgi:hypothetical protein